MQHANGSLVEFGDPKSRRHGARVYVSHPSAILRVVLLPKINLAMAMIGCILSSASIETVVS